MHRTFVPVRSVSAIRKSRTYLIAQDETFCSQLFNLGASAVCMGRWLNVFNERLNAQAVFI